MAEGFILPPSPTRVKIKVLWDHCMFLPDEKGDFSSVLRSCCAGENKDMPNPGYPIMQEHGSPKHPFQLLTRVKISGILPRQRLAFISLQFETNLPATEMLSVKRNGLFLRSNSPYL